MKPLKRHRRLVLNIELLQALRGVRTRIPLEARRFTVGMQSGNAAAIGLLEFLQIAIGPHSELSVQVEKVDLVTHAVFPLLHGGVLARQTALAVALERP